MGITSSLERAQTQMADRMAATCRAMQAEAGQRMMAAKMEGMKKRRDMERAMMISRAREMTFWIGGLWSIAATAVVVSKLRGRPVHPVAAVPLVGLGYSTIFQAEMGWGNRVQRLTKRAQHVLEHEYDLIK